MVKDECSSIRGKVGFLKEHYRFRMIESRETIIWELVVLITVTFSCLLTPIHLSMVYPSCDNSYVSFNVLDAFCDGLFIIQISIMIFQQRTIQHDVSEEVDSNYKFISPPNFKNLETLPPTIEVLCYVCSSLPLIATLTVLLSTSSSYCKSTIAYIGILRLLRVRFIPRQFKKARKLIELKREEEPLTSKLRMAIMFILFLIVMSASGCIYFISSCSPLKMHCSNTWTSTSNSKSRFSKKHWATVDEQMNGHWDIQYIRSIYFSMQTMFSIGYGDDVAPVSPIEIIFGCLLMYAGQFAFAGATANITSMIGNKDVMKMRFREEVDTLNIYLEKINIPFSFTFKVNGLCDYLFQRQFGVTDEVLLKSLPSQIYADITQHRWKMLTQIPYFSSLSQNGDKKLIFDYVNKLEMKVFTPNSVLVNSGEIQRDLFIVSGGRAEIYTTGYSNPIMTLLPGDFIGDHQLVLGGFNVVKVTTNSSYVETLVLSHQAMKHVLSKHSDFTSIQRHRRAVDATMEDYRVSISKFSKLRAEMKKAKLRSKQTAKKAGRNLEIMMKPSSNISHDKLVIEPNSKFHVYWDIVKLVSLLYICFATPLRLWKQCDERKSSEQRCSFQDCRHWMPDLFLDYFVDVIFILDMFLKYRCFAFTNIENGEELVCSDPELIKAKYLHSNQSLYDIFSSFPGEALSPIFRGYYSIFRLTHCLRIISLEEYCRDLQHHLELIKINISSATTILLTNLIFILIMFHVISVVWGIVHFRDPSEDPYWESLYWVITTFTTVGYGDIVPEDPIETGTAFIIGIGGAVFTAATIANVTANMQTMELGEVSLSHQKSCIQRFLRARKAKESTIMKISSYFAYMESSCSDIDGFKLLRQLIPSNFQTEFKILTNCSAVTSFPILASCTNDMLLEITLLLQEQYYIQGEEFFLNSQNNRLGMMVLKRGSAKLFYDQFPVKTLAKHDHFGIERVMNVYISEIEPGDKRFSNSKNLEEESVAVLEETIFWYLDYFDFKRVIEQFPENKEIILNNHSVYLEKKETHMKSRKPKKKILDVSAITRKAGISKTKNRIHPLISPMSSQDDRENEEIIVSCFQTWFTAWFSIPYWQILILICISWNIMITPFRSAFAGQATLGWYLIADYIVDMMVFLDFILCSNVMFYFFGINPRINDDYLNVDYLFVKIISIFPFEILILFLPQKILCNLGPLQVISLFRLNKLMQALELPILFSHVEKTVGLKLFRVHQNIFRITKLGCVAYFACHLFGSAFFFIGIVEHNSGQCNNWVDEAGLMIDQCDSAPHCSMADFDQYNAYTHALYWAVATLTTVGYGDIHATKGSLIETLYCTFVMLIGTFGVYSRVLSIFTHIVSQMDGTRSLFMKRSTVIDNFMHKRNVPKVLSQKIESYFKDLWSLNFGIRGTDILNYLPLDLHIQVLSEILEPCIDQIFFVKDSCRSFRELFLVSLEHEQFSENQILFVNREPAQRLFLLEMGVVHLMKDGSISNNLQFRGHRGGNVGDVMNFSQLGHTEFFFRMCYSHTAVTSSPVEIYSISYDKFWELILQKDLRTEFQKYVQLHGESLFGKRMSIILKDPEQNQASTSEQNENEINSAAEKHGYRIHPDSVLYKIWKILAFIFVVNFALITPFLLAFGESNKAEHLNLRLSSEMRILLFFGDVISAIFFFVDYIFHHTIFMCSFEGHLITQPSEFRKVYMYGDNKTTSIRKMYIIDSLSTVLLFIIPLNSFGNFESYRWLRCLHLSRVLQLNSYFQVFKECVLRDCFRIQSESTSLDRLIDWIPTVVLCNHWIACAFFYISHHGSESSWVLEANEICFGINTAESNPQNLYCSMGGLYLYAFYWALYTLTTTGYGRIQISSNHERIFAMFAMVLGGVMCDAGTTAILSDFFSEQDKEKAVLKRLTECSTAYIQNNNLSCSKILAQNCREYLARIDRDKLFDREAISYLPPALQTEVACHFCLEILSKSQMFEGVQQGLMRSMVSSMYPYNAFPNEMLPHLKDNNAGSVLYVLIEGICQVIDSTSSPLLHPGSIICNDQNRFRNFTNAMSHSEGITLEVQAKNVCFLYILDLNIAENLIKFLEHKSEINNGYDLDLETYKSQADTQKDLSQILLTLSSSCLEEYNELNISPEHCPESYQNHPLNDTIDVSALLHGSSKQALSENGVSSFNNFNLFLKERYFSVDSKGLTKAIVEKAERPSAERQLSFGKCLFSFGNPFVTPARSNAKKIHISPIHQGASGEELL